MCWLSGIFGPSVEMSLQEHRTEKPRSPLGRLSKKCAAEFIDRRRRVFGAGLHNPLSRCMLRGIWSIAKDSMIFLTRSGGFMLMIFCNVYHASRLQKHH